MFAKRLQAHLITKAITCTDPFPSKSTRRLYLSRARVAYIEPRAGKDGDSRFITVGAEWSCGNE